MTDSKCFRRHSSLPSPPLIQNGRLIIQAHHIGWIVTGLFTLGSTIISLWLVFKHLTWYTNKHEQRFIVRILFMVPIYSIVSFASFLFWDNSTPLLLIRDCYESTVLTSFFYLLLLYVSPSEEEQKVIFQKVGISKDNDREAIRQRLPTKKWMFPLSSVRSKPKDGLYFLQIMKWGILQYCFIRPITTLVAVILDYLGLYCESSWSPGWGYVYITIIVSVSVSIAMYCLVQVYVPVSGRLAPHKPLLKLFAIKAVVFLTFWQATFLSILSLFGVVKDTKYMTADDINIGIGAIAETVEMTIFALLHIKAFSYKPYRDLSHSDDSSTSFVSNDKDKCKNVEKKMTRIGALVHAFDFRETLREMVNGCAYILHRTRGVETDKLARRIRLKDELFSYSGIQDMGNNAQGSNSGRKTTDLNNVRHSSNRQASKKIYKGAYRSIPYFESRLWQPSHIENWSGEKLYSDPAGEYPSFSEYHRATEAREGQSSSQYQGNDYRTASLFRKNDTVSNYYPESLTSSPRPLDDPVLSRILTKQAQSEASGPTLMTSSYNCYHPWLTTSGFTVSTMSPCAPLGIHNHHAPSYRERSQEGSIHDVRTDIQQRDSRHHRELAFHEEFARDYIDHDNNLSQEKNKQLPPTPEKPSNSGTLRNTEELHDNTIYTIIPERQTESPKVKRKPAPRR